MNGRTITFKDVLGEAIEVDGLCLEASIEAIVRKCDDGTFEIEYWDMGDIYLSHGGNLIKLDQESFKNRNRILHGRFVNTCELYVLNKAKNAQESDYDEVAEYAV